jgi:hypothetical protein
MESKKQIITEQFFDKKKLHKIDTNNINNSNTINLENKKKLNKKRKLKEPKRCQLKECKKKLGIVKIKCKCELYFCPKHRTDHCCTYDYKANSKIKKTLINGVSNFKKLDKI